MRIDEIVEPARRFELTVPVGFEKLTHRLKTTTERFPFIVDSEECDYARRRIFGSHRFLQRGLGAENGIRNRQTLLLTELCLFKHPFQLSSSLTDGSSDSVAGFRNAIHSQSDECFASLFDLFDG